MDTDWARELLFADVLLALDATAARDVAAALERFQASPSDARRPIVQALEAAGAIAQEQREQAHREVERLLAAADGDPVRVLAHRGGIDRSIHASLAPQTAAALRESGTAARAPLRSIDSERYKEFTLISQGGMGVVYLVLDTELNREVAFKMVRPDPRASKEDAAPAEPLTATPPRGEQEARQTFDELKLRFLQEAWITSALEHPGVVPVYELGKTKEGIPYYTMRYVRGKRTLASAIKEADDLDARLALIEPFLKACDAVRYAHAHGILHRDLKPDNVALGTFGEAVVLDWGLSKATGDPEDVASDWQARLESYRDATDLRTVAGALGTPGYMAPEAALGRSEEVDVRSDVYSLGAMLYEILTGRLAIRFTTFFEYAQQAMETDPPAAHEVSEGVPHELSRICARALARAKEERFESVDELAGAIRRWQTEGRLQQQIDQLTESARTDMEAAGRSAGNMVLWHLDRAAAACTRVLHLKKSQPDALALRAEIKKLREHGIRGRVRAGRLKLIGSVAIVVLALGAIGALIVARTLKQERENAEAYVERADEELAAKHRDVEAARRARGEALTGQAGMLASLSETLLEQGDVAGARLAAARAATVAPTPRTWRALAAAEAQWAPALVAMLGDLPPGPLAVGPDGQRLFVCARGGKVKEFNLATRKYERVYATGAVSVLVLSPDGSRLLSATRAGVPRLWDTSSGKPAERLELPGSAKAGPVTAAAFSEDTTSVYTGHADGTVVSWSLTDRRMNLIQGTAGQRVTALRANRDGTALYVGYDDGVLSRADPEHLSRKISYDTPGAILYVTGTPEHDVVIACTKDHRVLALELDPVRIFTRFRGPGSELAFALLTPDNERLCVADRAGVTTVWSVPESRRLVRLASSGGKVTGFALSNDGTRLAVGAKGTVYVWALDGRTGRGDLVTAVARHGGRTWLARSDHTIELSRVKRWRAHDATITALASDGERIFSASLDGRIKVWTVNGGKLLASFKGPAMPTALEVGADHTVVTGAIDGAVEIWNWQRKRRVARMLDSGEQPVVALDVGERIRAWDDVGASRAWDPATHMLAGKKSAALPEPAIGEAVDWIRQDATRRLIRLENRLGVKLAGAKVIRVPLEEYRPEVPRLRAWSR